MSIIRSPKETYDVVEEVGVKKTHKTWNQSVVNGILAGMFIALGGYAAAVSSHSIPNYSLAKLVSGFIFPVGLILILCCGAELFTGNILLNVAVLEKKIKVNSMLKNWVLVYIGNFIGTLIIVFLIYHSGLLSSNHDALGGYAVKVATKKAELGFSVAFIRGILCNILVCMAVWASYAAKTATGKVLLIHIPIMAFIISGFEHSVANMYYLGLGFLAKNTPEFVEASHMGEAVSEINIHNMIGNLIPVTLGNIVGGAVFICGLYYLSYRKKA
ncbi:MAG: formate/nitrite transporter family protein [Vallitalea sp.]|jgi:formate/nitrite transporter|nr:formate/nitrite transporter family protein [Vallitalea sp.]